MPVVESPNNLNRGDNLLQYENRHLAKGSLDSPRDVYGQHAGTFRRHMRARMQSQRFCKGSPSLAHRHGALDEDPAHTASSGVSSCDCPSDTPTFSDVGSVLDQLGDRPNPSGLAQWNAQSVGDSSLQRCDASPSGAVADTGPALLLPPAFKLGSDGARTGKVPKGKRELNRYDKLFTVNGSTPNGSSVLPNWRPSLSLEHLPELSNEPTSSASEPAMLSRRNDALRNTFCFDDTPLCNTLPHDGVQLTECNTTPQGIKNPDCAEPAPSGLSARVFATPGPPPQASYACGPTAIYTNCGNNFNLVRISANKWKILRNALSTLHHWSPAEADNIVTTRRGACVSAQDYVYITNAPGLRRQRWSIRGAPQGLPPHQAFKHVPARTAMRHGVVASKALLLGAASRTQKNVCDTPCCGEPAPQAQGLRADATPERRVSAFYIVRSEPSIKGPHSAFAAAGLSLAEAGRTLLRVGSCANGAPTRASPDVTFVPPRPGTRSASSGLARTTPLGSLYEDPRGTRPRHRNLAPASHAFYREQLHRIVTVPAIKDGSSQPYNLVNNPIPEWRADVVHVNSPGLLYRDPAARGVVAHGRANTRENTVEDHPPSSPTDHGQAFACAPLDGSADRPSGSPHHYANNASRPCEALYHVVDAQSGRVLLP